MNLKRIDFNGKELVAIEQNGKIYVAMKNIVTNLGLDWEGQRQRIHRNEVLSSVTFIIKVTAEDGKEYDAKYGLVNTYSIDILKEVFDNYFNF